MSSSWKIGAVLGLLAGIIKSIVSVFSAIIGLGIGIPFWELSLTPITPTLYIATREITMGIIWGVILGIIYSKIYDRVPSKGVNKGILFGLAIFLFFSIRNAILYTPYTVPYAISWIFSGVFSWIAYGFVIGILFEFLRKYYPIKEKLEIKKYRISSGFNCGAVAGFAQGSVVALTSIINNMIYGYAPITQTISFLAPQGFFHIVINTFFGVIFGAIFVMFYDLIPSKGMKKAYFFSMIMFFVTSFQVAIYSLVYGDFANALVWSYGGFLPFSAFGIILGLLYRKPTETSTIKEKIVSEEKVEHCQHCGASIPKGSVFCNKCGRKQ